MNWKDVIELPKVLLESWEKMKPYIEKNKRLIVFGISGMDKVEDISIADPHDIVKKFGKETGLYSDNSCDFEVMKKVKNINIVQSPLTRDMLSKLWHYYDGPVRHVVANNAYIWSVTCDLEEISVRRIPAVINCDVLGKENCEDMTTFMFISFALLRYDAQSRKYTNEALKRRGEKILNNYNQIAGLASQYHKHPMCENCKISSKIINEYIDFVLKLNNIN